MATITGLTAARMEAIEAASIVDGEVVGDNLILTKFDASTIDTGNVRGPQGIQGPVGEITQAELDSALLDLLPVGTVCDYIGTTAPNSKWLLFGQTITGGETSHAALWAKLPASMKSGANIVLPSVAGKVAVAYDSGDSDFNAIGDVGGAKTATLTIAQLPVDTTTTTGSGSGRWAQNQPGAGFTELGEGSGSAHSIVQPFITLQKMIKGLP